MGGAHTIHLIRHGETASNAARILQTPEITLSETGVEQARRLAARLAGAGIARILSSDLERARMTARLLQETTGAPLHLDARLQERNFGDLRGTAYADLGFDPFAEGYAPPGGESIPMFLARVARAWEAIQSHAAAADGPLAVVTHGLVCRDLVAHHLVVPAELAAPADPTRWTNTCLTTIEGPPWTVRLLACTAHLSGEGTFPRAPS
jgi:probable phosphoglycerate mutase